jgi:hypothetical protein
MTDLEKENQILKKMSHSVRLDDNVFETVKATQAQLNKRKNGEHKKHQYTLSEVIEWYMSASEDQAASPI